MKTPTRLYDYRPISSVARIVTVGVLLATIMRHIEVQAPINNNILPFTIGQILPFLTPFLVIFAWSHWNKFAWYVIGRPIERQYQHSQTLRAPALVRQGSPREVALPTILLEVTERLAALMQVSHHLVTDERLAEIEKFALSTTKPLVAIANSDSIPAAQRRIILHALHRYYFLKGELILKQAQVLGMIRL